MEWVETTGRSVVEAMDAALDQLGVDEQEAEIQILEEPQKGLFGRLRVEARVRARVRPTAPRAKVDRRDRGRRNNKDRRRRKGSGQGSSTGSTEAKRPAKKSGTGTASKVPAEVGSVATETVPDEAGAQRGPSEDQRTNGRKRRRRRRGGAQRSGSQQGAKVADNESTDGEGLIDGGPEARPSLDVEAQRVAVDEFLTGLMAAFGRPDADVLTKADEEAAIVAEVQGDELGLLVGPKGQTLQALHELTRSVVQRRFVGEAHARLFLDVAGYRQRRTEALERFAQSVASEVLSSGRGKALEPMSASDRKVIHDVVNTIDGVRTLSEGEEPDRRVVIEKVTS